MSSHEIQLTGCTPEPLMAYLKALGVLRLVAEQTDPSALGCWRDGVFVLRSELDEPSLLRFFVDEDGYQPTPIFAPWNGDGGFLTDSGASFEVIEKVRKSNSVRLGGLRDTVRKIDSVPILRDFRRARDQKKALDKKKAELKKQKQGLSEEDAEGLKKATHRVSEIKEAILSRIRSGFPDEVVRWLDACVAILPEGFGSAPLLGSGGCDGRLEFSANFLSNLLLVLEADYETRCGWIECALFARGEAKLLQTAIGQFSPGQIGGPNATQGFEGDSGCNPFDFVLMIEGALLVSGAVSRRYGIDRAAKAAFPFTVFNTPVGYGSCSEDDARGSRGEMWLPLWPRAATLAEVRHVFAEGRADLLGRQAASGVEFARAVASLGIDRGVTGFTRYGFLPRNGRAFLATPLGRFDVRARPDVDLLRETDRWLNRFRGATSDEKTPPRFRLALRRIEAAIFDFCQHGGTARFAEILCAFGRAERELAAGERFRNDKNLSPLAGLSTDWLRAADDGSFEYNLALSLAGIHDREQKVGPLRANLEPVTWRGHSDWRGYVAWADKSRAVVWNSADLAANLTAVLERRLMDGDRNSCAALPVASLRSASLDAVSAFLAAAVDDTRIEDLLWGLLLVDHARLYPHQLSRPHGDAPLLPRAYALLKLVFLSDPLATKAGEVRVRTEPLLAPLLRAGRIGDACALAMRRLRVSGVVPMPYRTGRHAHRDAEWRDVTGSIQAQRLAAALLFPLHAKDVIHLSVLVLRPGEEPLWPSVEAAERTGR